MDILILYTFNNITYTVEIPVESEPIFESQILCLLHHRLNRGEGDEHFDSYYFD